MSLSICDQTRWTLSLPEISFSTMYGERNDILTSREACAELTLIDSPAWDCE